MTVKGGGGAMTDPLPSLRGCPSVAKGDAAISTAIRAISEADCFNRLRRSRNDVYFGAST